MSEGCDGVSTGFNFNSIGGLMFVVVIMLFAGALILAGITIISPPLNHQNNSALNSTENTTPLVKTYGECDDIKYNCDTYFETGKLIERQYQGAVPQGYDEEYFRKTGISKTLGESK